MSAVPSERLLTGKRYQLLPMQVLVLVPSLLFEACLPFVCRTGRGAGSEGSEGPRRQGHLRERRDPQPRAGAGAGAGRLLDGDGSWADRYNILYHIKLY